MLEVVITTAIIVVGLLGVSSLVAQNLRVQGINQYNLIASMLAQEGLEIARNIRDENWIDISLSALFPADWSDSLADTDGTIVLDYTNTNQFGNPPDDTPDNITDNGTRLFYTVNGLFTHVNTGNPSPFRRLITVIDNGGNIQVTCAVRWSGRGITRDYVAETYLYDWR
ncbi:hypothetical protein A2531_03535 [Candidatus Falkowbacteria bacterium RIFOXYD2_FULL_34_120]|uniref:Type 4 fimbrial biogenesis protein PilX N-terminal domain-containing protein n=1 Tax=Candidatus Falkowbacteria bacterium RIFOXYD2_FULL_34_120 TaxID=1798007 RepID=A0A1F5TNV0_9BACT|nr:MAG: hypothetical protein A2531_03535 [Candidatus Falkowbacteria bacterium RIFOXYD2_FULL_34_120]